MEEADRDDLNALIRQIFAEMDAERFTWRTLYSTTPLSYEVIALKPYRGDLLITTDEQLAKDVARKLNSGELELDADGNLPKGDA